MGELARVIILHHGDEVCPRCRRGKLSSKPRSFSWACYVCGHTLEKKCPCYFEKDLCRGCSYFKLCAHRPGISKATPIQERPCPEN